MGWWFAEMLLVVVLVGWALLVWEVELEVGGGCGRGVRVEVEWWVEM